MTSRKTEDRERGATLVEAAIVMPILLLLVVAIMELGLAFKDFLSVSYVSREGARVGALAGDDMAADCAILTALGELITPGDLERIQEIQIFKADPNTGAQGATNRAVYNTGNDPTVCTPPTGGGPIDGWSITYLGAGYPPTSRGVAVSATTGGSNLDIIGIRVILQRSWVTGFGPFSGSSTVDESTITRMEPEVYSP